MEGRPHPRRAEGFEEVAEWVLLLDSGFVFRDRVRV